jgi:hypothetical protein
MMYGLPNPARTPTPLAVGVQPFQGTEPRACAWAPTPLVKGFPPLDERIGNSLKPLALLVADVEKEVA